MERSDLEEQAQVSSRQASDLTFTCFHERHVLTLCASVCAGATYYHGNSLVKHVMVARKTSEQDEVPSFVHGPALSQGQRQGE